MNPSQFFIATATAAGAALLPILADSSIKGSVLLLGFALLAICMTRASAAARHLGWTVGLIGVIALPLLSLSLPEWRVLPTWMAMGQSEPLSPRLPAPSQPEASPAPTQAQILLDTPREVAAAMAEPSAAPANARTAVDTAVSPSAPDVRSASAPDEAAATGADSHSIALAIWLAGALLLSARLAIAQYRLWRFQGRTPEITAGLLHQTFENLRRELRIRRPVRLHVGQTRDAMPVAWGIFRSRIALPSAATGWDSERLRAVLLHELAHVRRWDCLTQFLAQGARALYWFHPLVWLAAWRMRVERERACDDYVLRNGFGAPDYAAHLLHIVSGCRAQRALHGASSVAMADRSGFESRLEAVLDGRADRRALTRTALLVTLLGTTAVLMPVAMLRAVDQQPADEDPTADEPPERANTAAAAPAYSARPNVPRDEDDEVIQAPEEADQEPAEKLKAEAEKLIRPVNDNFFDREPRAAAMIGLMNMLHPDRRDAAAAAASAIEASALIKEGRVHRHFAEFRKALADDDRAGIIEHTGAIKEAIQNRFWSSLRYVSTFQRGKPAPADRKEPLAPGRADAQGLVQSIYLKPHKKEYQPGDVIELHSVVRNTGKEPILVDTSYMSTEGTLISDEGTRLKLDWMSFTTLGINARLHYLLLPGEEFEARRCFSIGISADGVAAKGGTYQIETYAGETFEVETSMRGTIKVYDRTAQKFVAAHRADSPEPALVSGKLTLAIAKRELGKNKRDIHWADPVDGIAVGIQLEKRRWTYGFEPPLATAHVKLSAKVDKQVIKGPAAFTLELDGKRYRYSDQSGPVEAVTDFKTPIAINSDWISADDGKRLELLLGIRTARVHFLGKASPPVSFQLPGRTTKEWQDPWGAPSGGVKVGLRTLKPSWPAGEPPQVEMRLRNDNEEIKKGDKAAIKDAYRRWWTKATPADFELELDGVHYQAAK